MTESERRRRRPAVSCSLCRRRKLRCNREIPCSNCIRSRNEKCEYEKHPSQPPRQSHVEGLKATSEAVRDPLQPQGVPLSQASRNIEASAVLGYPSIPTISRFPPITRTSSSSVASTFSSQPSTEDIQWMKNEINRLQEQLSNATRKSTESLIPTPTPRSDVETSSSLGGHFHAHYVRAASSNQAQTISRSVLHKSRLFGQSHWINGIAPFLDIFNIIEPHIREESSKAILGIQRCKSLARVIKSQRAPPWPSPPSFDLPQRKIADKLVDCYLRTSEKLYRVLHIPTFMKEYNGIWVLSPGFKPNIAFMVQLKLVFAIGAAVYDERFSLRASATQWVYEAQTWLSEPEFKTHLTIQCLQNNILLLLARESAGIGGSLIWISIGTLLRSAVYMGLHRDPGFLPKMTIFAAEIRRRLWNTILEIALQSSIDIGGSPLVSLDNFDTKPPGNFDDAQLETEDPVPGSGVFTETSVAITLRETFPLRLEIVKCLNDLGSQFTYEEALRLDAELKSSYKTLRRKLQDSGLTTGRSQSRFEEKAVDFIMLRWHLCLHVPFFGHETAYAYSRKVVVENSLKMWRAASPVQSITPSQSQNDTPSSDHDDFARLVLCGSGFFRISTFQSIFLIAVELKTQLQEEVGLGPISLRSDLLSVLEDGKAWALRCIEAGETNVKGYLLISMVNAQITALMHGTKEDEIPILLVQAIEESEDKSMPILEKLASEGQEESTFDAGLNQMSLDTLPNLAEDWDFMMSDAKFNFGDADPMGWGFNGEPFGRSSLW